MVKTYSITTKTAIPYINFNRAHNMVDDLEIGVISVYDGTYNKCDSYQDAEEFAKELVLEHIRLGEYPVNVKIVQVLHTEYINE